MPLHQNGPHESAPAASGSSDSDPTTPDWMREALTRNDRYLHEFVESLAICPFARTCRETGRLHREVLAYDSLDVDGVVAHIRHLEAHGDPEFEVGLLIFPQLLVEVKPFERFVSQVVNSYQAGRQGPVAFFIVAFHPDLPMNLKNADVAVRFMRRSPDPTIQLVRPSAIERVRRGARDDEGDALSRHVAEAGLRAVSAAGPEAVAAQLAELRSPERKALPVAAPAATPLPTRPVPAGVVSGSVVLPRPRVRPE